MKVEDIREWDEAEIEARMKELKEEQFKLRFTASMMAARKPQPAQEHPARHRASKDGSSRA